MKKCENKNYLLLQHFYGLAELEIDIRPMFIGTIEGGEVEHVANEHLDGGIWRRCTCFQEFS